MKHTSFLSAMLFAASLATVPAHAQGPVFNGVGAGNLIDFTTWNLYGSANASNVTPGNGFTYSILSLTSPGTGGQGGAAFAPDTVALDFNQAFTITFDFYISPGTVVAGDGMTFVLTPDDPNTVDGGSPLVPSGGSDLGYGNSGLSGLAFAIDTFNFDGEPIAPSIQILENGSVVPLAYTETGLADIRDPGYFQWGATLSYTPSGLDDMQGDLTGTIDQYIGSLSFSVSATVDGTLLHNQSLYYGFTGANGLADDGHYVSSAVPVPEPETWAMLLAGLGLVGWAARRRTS
ncbi:MAG: PEPxxWA-CTERM sorting domain-containing protein [Thiobacillus sp.]|nr:PEPxxWA-CTERM sorting domain-containing protein [Thiobacillus sp.]